MITKSKTRVGIIAIKKFINKNPDASVMVVVPTRELKDQWIGLLITNGLAFVTVEVINTVVKKNWETDFLIIDECHMAAAAQLSNIFKVVKYKIILGLTATLERLDGRHVIIQKYCPLFDTITIEECIKNNWVSNYKKYKVLLDVDLTEYNTANSEFYNHFAFFGYDFNKAMSCVGPSGYIGREEYLKEICTDTKKYSEVRKEITAHAYGFMRSLQARKQFIANNPRKIEVTNLILEHRKDKKAITFSPTIKVAEKITYGGVLHSGQTRKKRSVTLEEFNEMKTGVLNTSKALNVGADIQGVNLGIILGIDSSKTTLVQRTGRIIRYSPDKEAEIFILVIKGTVEEAWFEKSNEVSSYITVDEEGLLNLLNGKDYIVKKEKSSKVLFRF